MIIRTITARRMAPPTPTTTPTMIGVGSAGFGDEEVAAVLGVVGAMELDEMVEGDCGLALSDVDTSDVVSVT